MNERIKKNFVYTYINICIYTYHILFNSLLSAAHRQDSHSNLFILPVIPHKAVAEVSKIGNYRRGELL